MTESENLDGADPAEVSQTDSHDYISIEKALRFSAIAVPPVSSDPVAAMLGLVPDQACVLSSVEYRKARRSNGMATSEVADRLRRRGWTFTSSQVRNWELRDDAAVRVPPAVIQALATVLKTDIESIVRRGPNGETDRLKVVRERPLFRELALRWAQARRISLDAAIAALDSRMASTVHRGSEPEPDQLLASLEELVTAVEQAGKT